MSENEYRFYNKSTFQDKIKFIVKLQKYKLCYYFFYWSLINIKLVKIVLNICLSQILEKSCTSDVFD